MNYNICVRVQQTETRQFRITLRSSKDAGILQISPRLRNDDV